MTFDDLGTKITGTASKDRFGLVGDLSYDDLTFCGSTIYADNELLVTLTGVDTEQLTNQDFTINLMISHKSN